MKDTNISQTKNLYTPGRQKDKILFLIYRNTIQLLKDWEGVANKKTKRLAMNVLSVNASEDA